MQRAFTFIELLVCIAIIAILAALIFPVIRSFRAASARAISLHSLQQLSAAGQKYLGENDHYFWKYSEPFEGGTQYWFGWESPQSRSRPEGEREIDYSRGPLGPYAIASGGVKTDPAFLAASPRLKPKFKNGNYGYGYNTLLAEDDEVPRPYPTRNALRAERPSEVILFATCAQVNAFQKPASSKNPMIEEFYMINQRETTVHFRHGGKAIAAFLDGSARELEMDKGTLDKRMPEANIGRFAPVGSRKWLW